MVTKAVLDAAPFSIWNAFIRLLAEERYEDLASEQRPAQLCFRYDGEVQNGGHLQYFENGRCKHLDETILALKILNANCQQDVLREASFLWRSKPRPRIENAQGFCETALEGEFSTHDMRYYRCTPSLTERLEEHLNLYQSNFVLIA